MTTEKSPSQSASKTHLRNVRIVGALFALGGIGFILLFEFNIGAVFFGSILIIVGLIALLHPRSVDATLMILADALSLYP